MKMVDYGTPEKPLRISEVDFDAYPKSHRVLTLTGDAFMRGETYGRVFADKISANVARHLDHPALPPT